jgi:hypothetical protein
MLNYYYYSVVTIFTLLSKNFYILLFYSPWSFQQGLCPTDFILPFTSNFNTYLTFSPLLLFTVEQFLVGYILVHT